MKNNVVRVVVADDHELFLDGLEQLLNQRTDVLMLGRAENGAELLDLVRKSKPDVVVTDLRMPDMTGVEIVRELSTMPDKPACIIISMFDDEYLVVDAAEAGALGYVTKGAKKIELLEAIFSVAKKVPYFSQSTASKLITYYLAKDGAPVNCSIPFLTDLQKEIVRYICDGLSSKEIGQKMFRGQRWVELERSKILHKLGVKTSLDVLKEAVRLGIYHPDEK